MAFSTSRVALLLACVTGGALAVCALALAGVLLVTVPLANGRIQPEQGKAFVVNLPWGLFAEPGDDASARFQGASKLTENDRQLGPGRQMHQDIRQRGGGLFALNGYSLRFSTSDNSDPRNNKRRYQLTMPVVPSPIVLLALLPGIVVIVLRAAANTDRCVPRNRG